MNLFIVESPSKIKKIREILGDVDYCYGASVGHISELDPKSLAVDVDNGFKPFYQLSERGKEVVAKLKPLAAKCSRVILATDLDREGEAIAWHLKRYLGLEQGKYVRVVYNEITAPALRAAIANARDIDMKMVAAQECRVVLDRLVGYPVSQAMQKRSTIPLSAGRVQTVALLIIVRRELEIGNFSPTPHYLLRSDFVTDQTKWAAYWDYRAFAGAIGLQLSPDNSSEEASATDVDEQKATQSKVIWTDQVMINQIRQSLAGDVRYDVIGVRSKPNKRSAPPPLTTSLMQQVASTQLSYSADETMSLAQKLFEAGMITYHRTDSKNLSNESIAEIREWIQAFEKEKGLTGLLPPVPKRFDNGANAQEAHEAIRPSHIKNRGNTITDPKMRALYELIWMRAVASQMSPAEYESTHIRLRSRAMVQGVPLEFDAKGNKLIFAGWRTLVSNDQGIEDAEKKGTSTQLLPNLHQGDLCDSAGLEVEPHKTASPPRYTEASLVAALERSGVGRPSTYASIIKKILDRRYVALDKRKFIATPLGIEITKSLAPVFSFVDVGYTGKMEQDLDLIASGQSSFKGVIASLWNTLSQELLVYQQDSTMFKATGPVYKCHHCQTTLRRFKRKNSETEFLWVCGNHETCGIRLPEINGRPPRIAADYRCKECGKPLTVRRSKNRIIRFYCVDSACGAGYEYQNGVANLDINLFPKTSDHECPTCQEQGRTGYLIRHIGKDSKRPFWACNTQACPAIFPEIEDSATGSGKPNLEAKPLQTTSEHVCPRCKKGRLVIRESRDQSRSFWVCNQKKCDTFIDDAGGVPDLQQDTTGPRCPLCEAVGQDNYLKLKTIGDKSVYVCQGMDCGQKVEQVDGQPDSKFLSHLNDIGMKFKLAGTRSCTKCKKGVMRVNQGSKGPFLACNRYPKCKHTEEV
ncbi:TPA: type I DNA topoisomerase [Aeromonas hydrophila subsp. hydrophila]